MTVFQALVLGLIQGLTEFFPVSSSGHLIIVPLILGWAEQPLAFDTTMHLATALALLLFFSKDLWSITKALFKDVITLKFAFKNYSKKSWLGFMLLIGSFPAGVLGLVWGDTFERVFRSELSVIFFMCLGTLLMAFSEYIYVQKFASSKTNTFVVNEDTTILNSLVVGIFQALALLPGVSRSGATVAGAMFLGFSREEAFRFSFLLSLPIVLLAGSYKAFKTNWFTVDISLIPLLAGFFMAFVSGYFALRFLARFFKEGTLKPFIMYRVILILILLGLILL